METGAAFVTLRCDEGEHLSVKQKVSRVTVGIPVRQGGENVKQIESTGTLVWREHEPRHGLSALDRVAAETDLYAEIYRTGEAHGGLFVIHYRNGATVTLSYPRGIRHVTGTLPTWRIADSAEAREVLSERALLPVTLPHVEIVSGTLTS